MTTDKNVEKEALSKFTMPVIFEHGYIFDSKHNMMMQVRGWGYLGKFENGDELQDAIGQMFANAFNEALSASDGKLVEKLDEYIKLLADELSETVSFAAGHNWKSQRYDEGVKLREEIKNLRISQEGEGK